MGYVTRFTPHAQRDMLKVERPDALRILYRIAELQKAMDVGDVAAFDIKALQGQSTRWRLRIGDYQVVYTVEDGQLVAWTLAIGNVGDPNGLNCTQPSFPCDNAT
ncbi:type II toxin-antitoxin system RelE family toxin [Streptomyces fungicidicus]|uniref:Addiction module toxin RelE n=1 Tax=Streptomyces fungicidicus TaxID=68203 RepID=A0A494UQW0_9ACTN|nr:type II toxin-antitoxin system RelE/ParE family toxin [Streptomyces fungicidicus]AYL36910.1 addiction module toxin RelE [Streptomyces fungicidicus]